MKKLFAAAILLTAGFSMSAHAGLISGPITFDGGKSVDLQGLEWMPVTYTAGLSRVDVEGGFSDVTKMWGTGGWRYATRAETEKLLGSLWGGRYDGWSFDNFAGASTFLEAFGATGSYGTMHRYSYFYFGKPEDCVTLPGYTCFASLEAVAEYDYDLFSSDRTANWQQSISFKAGQSGAGRFLESAGVDMGKDPYYTV